MEVLWALSSVVGLVFNIWVVSTIVGILTATQILRGLYSKKNGPILPVSLLNCDTIVRELLKIAPVGVAKGWHLLDVLNGVRLWRRPLSVTRKGVLPSERDHEWNVVAATLKVELSPKEIVQSMSEHRELFSWMVGLHPPVTLTQSQVISSSQWSDSLSYVLPPPPHSDGLGQLLNMAMEAVRKGSFGYLNLAKPQRKFPKQINIQRKWQVVNPSTTCMIWRSDAPADVGVYWTCCTFMLDKTTEVCSFASVAAIPVPGQEEQVKNMISSQLCALSQHLKEKKSGFYRPVNKDKFLVKNITTALTLSSPIKPPTHSSRSRASPTTLAETGERQSTSPSPVVSGGDPSLTSTSNARRPTVGAEMRTQQVSSSRPHSRYASTIDQYVEKMIREGEGTESSGWIAEGVKKGVTTSKKMPGPGEPAYNSVRGSGAIAVPPEFIFKYLQEEHAMKELDPMLKSIELIERPEPFCDVARLSYSPVRPTTARDFCLLSYSCKTDPHTFVFTATSITHPDCPEVKGFVRGELMIAGWIIKNDLDNPASSHVIYVTQVDLKGYVPSFVVNKVTAMQPMRVDKLREIVTAEYEKALSDPSVMAKYDNIAIPTFPEAQPEPEPEPEPQQLSSPAGVASSNPQSHSESSLEPPRDLNLSGKSAESFLVISSDSDPSHEGRPAVEQQLINPVVSDVGPRRGQQSQRMPRSESAAAATTNHRVPSHRTTSNGGEQTFPDFQSMHSDVDSGHSLDHHRQSPRHEQEDLETFTPDEMSSDSGDGEGARGRSQQWSMKSLGGNPVFERIPWKCQPGTPTSVSSLTHSETPFSMSVVRDSFVDFRTLANQIAASVYEETFNVSSVIASNPSTHTLGQKGWKFQGFEKNTVLLRKKKPDSAFECFAGKTTIPLAPEQVFQCIRNPTMRFSYDNMLKELEFIRRIDDDLYILHMVHETTHCLMKQARDFCLLVSERIMSDQLMVVGTSVEVPDCPVNPSIRRGRILTSGWVLEAHITSDNKRHCNVTYLVQLDVGGAPPQLVNLISKRQPLAVAYLRDYLTGGGMLPSAILDRQSPPMANSTAPERVPSTHSDHYDDPSAQ